MIAIISDIHGNYEALRSVLEEIDKVGVSEILCLGDVVGYYCQVNECCDELRGRNVKCVMGNHDWYIASGVPCSRSHSVNDCLEYQKKVITFQNLEWIRSFPVFRMENSISMLHGGWTNPIDEYLNKPNQQYFADILGIFFASGHTHIQLKLDLGDKIYCNPGSIGQPRDGDCRAAFALFDGSDFYLKRVSYNYFKVGKLMEEAGFNSYYYGCLRDGSPHLHK